MHLLPLELTHSQRCVLQCLGRLHAPHLASKLGKPDSDLQPPPANSLTSQQMCDLFVQGARQTINHPTLLVDHYIPKNMLLLATKQSIAGPSAKYTHLNELLDKLAQRPPCQSIVVCVSNTREMDILESILLGKVNLQYYRFSGSSLYYDKIPLNPQQINSTSTTAATTATNGNKSSSRSRTPAEKSSTVSPTPPLGSSSQINNGRATGGRGGRGRGRGRGGNTGNFGSNASSNGRSGLTNNGQSNSNTGSGTSEREYKARISKNSKNLPIKREINLKVFLVLPMQLKHISDVKPDLVISLDNNCGDFDLVSNALGRVPILKPIVLNSIEHFDWKLRNSGLEGPELNALLTDFTMASLGKIGAMDEPKFEQAGEEKNAIVDDKLLLWINNGCPKYEYPYPSTYDICVPLKVDGELTEMVQKVADGFSKFENDKLTHRELNYTYFQQKDKDSDIVMKQENNNTIVKEEPDSNADSTESVSKKIKLSATIDPSKIPPFMTYQHYQSTLASLIFRLMTDMQDWMEETMGQLNTLHLSETERQLVLDDMIVHLGELYKKDRDLGVAIEAKIKQETKAKLERERLQNVLKDIKDRYENIANLTINDDVLSKVNDQIEEMQSKIQILKSEIESHDNHNENLRSQYRQISTDAANISTEEKNQKALVDQLTQQSQGAFIKLKQDAFKDRTNIYNENIAQMSKQSAFNKEYIELLQKVRGKNIDSTTNSTSASALTSSAVSTSEN